MPFNRPRDGWQELPAGKELDRIVAEYVGWRLEVTEAANMYARVYSPSGSWTGLAKIGSAYGDYVFVQGQGWPQYTEDADAALGEVNGVMFQMERGYVGPNKKWWRAIVNLKAAEAEEPAEAICRALLAWGGPIGV